MNSSISTNKIYNNIEIYSILKFIKISKVFFSFYSHTLNHVGTPSFKHQKIILKKGGKLMDTSVTASIVTETKIGILESARLLKKLLNANIFCLLLE